MLCLGASVSGCGGGAQHLTQLRLDLGQTGVTHRAGRPNSGRVGRPDSTTQQPRILNAGARQVIVSPTVGGVQLIAADATGRVRWRRDIAKGSPDSAGTGDRLLWVALDGAASGDTLIGVDIASGETRWRTTMPGVVTATAWLAPYVVAQVGGQVVLVHAARGAIDATWRAKTLVGAGAGSWLWLHSDGMLSGIDITRVRCTTAGCVPRPRWRVPFGAKPRVVGAALCGASLPRLQSCVDGITGARRWLDYAALLPTLDAGSAGLIARGRDAWGAPYVAALNPRDLKLRWRTPTNDGVVRVEHNGALLSAWSANAISVLRARDGAVLASLAVPTQLVRAATATPTALTWIFGAGASASIGTKRLRVKPTSPTRLVSPRHADAATPPWVRPGLVLHYVEVRFDHRDSITGDLVDAEPPRPIDVRLETLDAHVRLRITTPSDKPRTLTVPREHPIGLAALLLGDAQKKQPPREASASPIHIAASTLQALRLGEQVSLLPDDPGAVADGYGLHRIGYVGRGKQRPTPRDLRGLRLRGLANRGPHAYRYLIAPWPTLPLVLRIDGPRRLLLLTAVVTNTP